MACVSCSSPAQKNAAPLTQRSDWTLSGPLFSGGEIDLAEDLAAGTPVTLVFWQSWCGSCVEEAPHVNAAARELKGRMRVVGVVSGPDGPGDVDEMKLSKRILELGLTYPQIRDRDLSITRQFDVKGTPTVVILSPDGKVLYNDHQLPESWDAYL